VMRTGVRGSLRRGDNPGLEIRIGENDIGGL
jgi:hypothetical protein